MSALISLSIKGKEGKYNNYTISVNDTVNDYGQNVTMYAEQTKEERESKAKKNYIGNGKVVWTDGKITVAPKTEQKGKTTPVNDDDLPF